MKVGDIVIDGDVRTKINHSGFTVMLNDATKHVPDSMPLNDFADRMDAGQIIIIAGFDR